MPCGKTGWKGESVRHSNAKRMGRAGPMYKGKSNGLKRVGKRSPDKFYKITSLAKDDIIEVLPGRKAEIMRLSDMDMRYLARKLAEDYTEQLYWQSLKEMAEDYLDGKIKK